MVVAEPKLEVRTVGAESFDDIYPLLLLFRNQKMSRDDWRRMLFTNGWGDGHPRGFALYAGGAAVGFMGTIFSSRRIAGRDETICNASCWIVREDFRSASMLLLRPLLGMRDCTIVNLTPTPRSYEIFKKLGFVPLETEQLLLPPIANPAALAGGTFATAPRNVLASLGDEERAIYHALESDPDVVHLVLRRAGRSCYLVAAPRRVKRAPFAELLYVGDPEFFWRNRALAHLAVTRRMGALGISVDGRFARGRDAGVALRRPALRSYRPARPDISPAEIDGLFSELMVLKI